MYFQSNRSSRDGMAAVGSVVMNRVASRQYVRPAGVGFEVKFDLTTVMRAPAE